MFATLHRVRHVTHGESIMAYVEGQDKALVQVCHVQCIYNYTKMWVLIEGVCDRR